MVNKNNRLKVDTSKISEANILYRVIKEREDMYKIADFKPLEAQEQLIQDIQEKDQRQNKYRYLNYQGGNGSGKTQIGAYLAVRLAGGKEMSERLNLDFIGSKKNIWIATESGENVINVIEPYLLGKGSKSRIPEEFIEGSPHYNNRVLKSVRLKNGSNIKILTYDQGYTKFQGGNVDLIWLDEDPAKDRVWEEILARGRIKNCQILLTMTPTQGITKAVEFFKYEQPERVESRKKLYMVNSGQNTYIDMDWAYSLTSEQRKMRVEGIATPPTGLVFPEFTKENNVVTDMEDTDIGDYLRYYRAIDFGVNHPTAVLFIAVNGDGTVYVYDEIHERNTLLKDIVSKINKKSLGKRFKYTVADSASKRERLEIKQLGINTIPADKFSKGENNLSNRKAGIIKINQMLFDKKLIISDKCVSLIKEFENHFYKKSKNDGEVEKERDDALDALRYFIFGYRPPDTESKLESRYKKFCSISDGISGKSEDAY